jgi:hypothetical protein
MSKLDAETKFDFGFFQQDFYLSVFSEDASVGTTT